jgi:hypothetical protein
LLREYFEFRKSDFQQERGKAKLTVVQGDLVTANEKYKMHFTSADMKRTRGVAVPFAAEYGPADLSQVKLKVGDIYEQSKNDTTLLNLVHKDKYFFKFHVDPEKFLANITVALEKLRDYCVDKKIERLALVRVASMTEKVHWRWTQHKLLEIFENVDITLALYLQKKPKKRFHKTNSTPEGTKATSAAKTAELLETVKEKLSNLERKDDEVDISKGNVGGGSLPKLPSPNHQPPRHNLPDKVIVVGQGVNRTNSTSGPRNDEREKAKAKKPDASKGAIPKQRKEDKSKTDALPRHLSGGGGTTTPSPPSSVPPLTTLHKEVIQGTSDGNNVPNATSSSMAAESDLSEMIQKLRGEMARMRDEFADLRRSVTPGRTRSLAEIPVSPASNPNVSQRGSSRGLSLGVKNKPLAAPPKVK